MGWPIWAPRGSRRLKNPEESDEGRAAAGPVPTVTCTSAIGNSLRVSEPFRMTAPLLAEGSFLTIRIRKIAASAIATTVTMTDQTATVLFPPIRLLSYDPISYDA